MAPTCENRLFFAVEYLVGANSAKTVETVFALLYRISPGRVQVAAPARELSHFIGLFLPTGGFGIITFSLYTFFIPAGHLPGPLASNTEWHMIKFLSILWIIWVAWGIVLTLPRLKTVGFLGPKHIKHGFDKHGFIGRSNFYQVRFL
ncbi:MAG TPA: hypothetical protein VMW42_05155 [Desulfatiglandales bacterium]|nr:hypothetical protein [Desulfatiglandales bacterium]